MEIRRVSVLSFAFLCVILLGAAPACASVSGPAKPQGALAAVTTTMTYTPSELIDVWPSSGTTWWGVAGAGPIGCSPVCGPEALWRTSDGGLTWHVVWTPPFETSSLISQLVLANWEAAPSLLEITESGADSAWQTSQIKLPSWTGTSPYQVEPLGISWKGSSS